MAIKHGVYTSEKTTSVSTPVVAECGIPFVVGTAPVQAAETPAKANVPVLLTSWDEAVEQFGFSYDWESYTLCEFMYSHFQLFGCQPVLFCNVLDIDEMSSAVAETAYDVEDHEVELPYDVISGTLAVQTSDGTVLTEDTDFTVTYDYDDAVCTISLLEDGAAYDATSLTISYSAADPTQVTAAKIVAGLSAADECMTRTGTIPDLICCPGWSHLTTVAAVMATKAESVSGLFGARALIDFDTSADGVRSYTELYEVKNNNNFVENVEILCWPRVKNGDYMFHMSTQLAGLMASVDTDNGGVPYESPSNKNFKMDGCCLDDGTEVNLTWTQANVVNGYGIVTALNFMGMGWVCWGNYNACYPSNTDVKDYFIPIARMFDWVASTLIQTFWSKVDRPMNRILLDTITNSTNIWLDGLVGSGYLLGARAEILDSENTTTDLMAGIIHIHIYITPPSPMQECDFVLEYDTSYVESALGA